MPFQQGQIAHRIDADLDSCSEGTTDSEDTPSTKPLAGRSKRWNGPSQHEVSDFKLSLQLVKRKGVDDSYYFSKSNGEIENNDQMGAFVSGALCYCCMVGHRSKKIQSRGCTIKKSAAKHDDVFRAYV